MIILRQGKECDHCYHWQYMRVRKYWIENLIKYYARFGKEDRKKMLPIKAYMMMCCKCGQVIEPLNQKLIHCQSKLDDKRLT